MFWCEDKFDSNRMDVEHRTIMTRLRRVLLKTHLVDASGSVAMHVPTLRGFGDTDPSAIFCGRYTLARRLYRVDLALCIASDLSESRVRAPTGSDRRSTR